MHFDPTAPDLRIWVRLVGPRGAVWCEMVLDTGSSRTVIDDALLARLGYDLLAAPQVTVATASGRTDALLVVVKQLTTLGETVRDFPVLAMPLIRPLRADGLLGLDFLRRRNLFFDFDKGILLTTFRSQLAQPLFACRSTFRCALEASPSLVTLPLAPMPRHLSSPQTNAQRLSASSLGHRPERRTPARQN